MSVLLAAIDDSAATGPVVAVAQRFAAVFDLELRALHVSENGDGQTARAAADAAGIRFELRSGEPVRTIRAAAAEPDVGLLAIGVRGGPARRIPAGRVALDLLRCVAKPVIVVPPDACMPRADHPCVLAPVDEDPNTATALRGLLEDMKLPDLGLVLLRVFDAEHVPMFSNHGAYETEAVAREFVYRTVPAELARTRVETRFGHPTTTILDVERELGSDVVVLAWGRTLEGERASVVKRLLADSKTPLLLVPAVKRADPNAVNTQNAHSGVQ